MTHVLYLVRHGIAGPPPPGMSDADRALTADGKRKMRRVGIGLKRLGLAPDAVLSSPLRRAEETAAIVRKTLARSLPVEIYPLLAPGHAAPEILKGLRSHRAARELVLVGHQPDLGLLASYLLTRSTHLAALPFKKGAVAAIGVDMIPPRAPGMLMWFMTPKQLRTLGARHKRRRRGRPRHPRTVGKPLRSPESSAGRSPTEKTP
jgi:phosphohistidine phosphatase